MNEEQIKEALRALAEQIHVDNREKGFWPREIESPEEVWAAFLDETPDIEKSPIGLQGLTLVNIHALIAFARETMPRNEAEMLMLEVSELAETLEGIRHDNPPSEKIPDYTQAEEELADCLIRLCDHAHGKHPIVIDAIFAKLAYNRSRPFKHGKKF